MVYPKVQTIVLKMRYNKKNKCLENVLCGRRYNMSYKKEIIELIESCENEGKLKFVYMILIKYLKSKEQGD